MKKPKQKIAFKSISGIVVLLVVFSAIVSTIGFRGFTDALLSQYAEGAFRTAETAAFLVDPAREVGGDFYDYFFVDEDHLCLVMADVSGKGIPAALFMMASKIILASNAKMGKSPAQILADTNAAICANNKEGMFVTVWLGIVEISTGRMTAANAGHEYPILRHPDGRFELIRDKHGFVIGGMEGSRYREYELLLEKGATLFLYTDGVPEAMNAEGQMFGTERLLNVLNEEPSAAPVRVLGNVRRAVDDFVKDTEQFDDLTMLCFHMMESAGDGSENKEQQA